MEGGRALRDDDAVAHMHECALDARVRREAPSGRTRHWRASRAMSSAISRFPQAGQRPRSPRAIFTPRLSVRRPTRTVKGFRARRHATMAVLEEIEDEPAPAPAPSVAPAPAEPEEEDSDDEPPPLDSAEQREALMARKLVSDRVAAARTADGAGPAPESRASGGAAPGGVKKGFFDAPPARSKPAGGGMKKGFFDAPRPKPKPKSSEPEMVFLKAKKTTTASGAQIPDFMRVEVEGSEAAEKMKKELMNKLKPDKQTVDEVLNNADLMSGFDDPEVMRAVDDVAKDPRNMRKYANNPKVLQFYSRMAGMVGNRLEKMGDNSASGR